MASAVWFLYCILLMSMLSSTEGAIQSLSISFDSLSSANTTHLSNYGEMGDCYIVYQLRANLSSLGQATPAAGILFIPTPSNSSFILSIVIALPNPRVPPYLFYSIDGAVIWMANRNNPVSGNFSLLLDQTSGNLLLFNGNGDLAWSSNIARKPAGIVSMELITDPDSTLPLGTLRLFDGAHNKTLWQSSDHPSHGLMSKQYLQPGLRLTSWASLSDPSPGPYDLVMEPGGIVLYYNPFQRPGYSQPYWVLGRSSLITDLFSVTHTCHNLTTAVLSLGGGIVLSDFSAFVLMPSDEIAQPNQTSANLCKENSDSDLATLFRDSGGQSNAIFLTLQYDGNVVATGLDTQESVYDVFGDNRCSLPNYCGPYGVCTPPKSYCECPSSSKGSFASTFPVKNPLQGCPLAHNLTCTHNQTTPKSSQSFLTLIGVDNFSNNYSSPLNFSTRDTCKAACLHNCSCLAAFWREHTSSCFHVDAMGSLISSANSSYLAFLKVEADAQSSPSPAPSASPRHAYTLLVAGVVSGAVGLLICLCLLAAFNYRRKLLRADPESEEEDTLWNMQPGLPTRYSYKDLHSITDGFSEQMGKGGFGTVYAGVLQDGTRVAVKRLESLHQGKKEFKAEVVILGGIHHHNLVGLLGFCAEGSHRLLVYEYMAKGSLDQWLFTTEITPLHWKYRFNIALGAARGLAYLHHDCKHKIIHLDIKPQNILVDENFVAKVSDFGLSKLMARDQSHVVTTMRGTPGYLAPEWLTEGSAISEKCDVFSFGKLLMEILGGRRNLEPSLADTAQFYFPAWLYNQMTQAGTDAELAHIARVETPEEMRQGTDAELAHIARVETPEEIRQARLLMNTAFLCVVEDPHLRPSMETVVHMLEGHAPELEHLQVSNHFPGLHFALRMTTQNLAQAPSGLLKLGSTSSQGGVMSFHISAR